MEFWLKGFKAWREVGRSLCSLGRKQGWLDLRGAGESLSWAGARDTDYGGYSFNWAFICQQPALALLSWAWVLRARSSGQDKGPTGRAKPTRSITWQGDGSGG